MSARVLLLSLLLSFTLLLSLTLAQSPSTIFIDYTNGFSTVLLNPPSLSIQDLHPYDGGHPGSFRFGVMWNNDASDTLNLTVPTNVHITAENNASYCTPPLVVFNASTPRQCNYTAQWTSPAFSGQMTLAYTGGPVATVRTDTITIFFTNTAVLGDPQFVGLRGQSYQVHGMDGAIYNLISDKNLQVNSRFVFLTEGQCPIIDGVVDTNCWSHPGSYIGEMSFQQVVDGKLHAALITSGDAKSGFSMVQMDGKEVTVGQTVTFGSFSLTRTSAYSVSVQTEQFSFVLSNSDLFINQALASKVSLSKLHAHGLLGQTHSFKTYPNAVRHIEGEVDDYVIADSDIFGHDFLYNRFQPQ